MWRYQWTFIRNIREVPNLWWGWSKSWQSLVWLGHRPFKDLCFSDSYLTLGRTSQMVEAGYTPIQSVQKLRKILECQTTKITNGNWFNLESLGGTLGRNKGSPSDTSYYGNCNSYLLPTTWNLTLTDRIRIVGIQLDCQNLNKNFVVLFTVVNKSRMSRSGLNTVLSRSCRNNKPLQGDLLA